MSAHRAFALFAHVTWHTWNRTECVDAAASDDVKIALLSAGKRTGVRVIRSAVLSNHVHAVVSFRPDTQLCDFIRLAKAVAATRANRRVDGTIRWARGYYVRTVCKGDLPRVLTYIEKQFSRHQDLVPKVTRSSSDPGRKPGVNKG
ncbi:MAG: transposase [Gemmatimonadales bacterium]